MKDLLNYLGLKLLPSLLTIYLKTLRIRTINIPDFKSEAVYVFWHSKMLTGWWIFKNKKFGALVSQSKDGEILNNVLLNWKYKVIRGSSSKSGKEALSEIINVANNGASVVLTPDGPRGPACILKNGALAISFECKIPIVPLKIINHNKKILSESWDNFEIPFPFSKCEIHFGERVFYEEYLYGNDLEKFKQSLSNKMQ